ncbi:MAG: hypothetical protein EBX67_02655 [Betaproteobacteria bacterium]|nr:hypothetical protein [Betaproteobacteria bacterium]
MEGADGRDAARHVVDALHTAVARLKRQLPAAADGLRSADADSTSGPRASAALIDVRNRNSLVARRSRDLLAPNLEARIVGAGYSTSVRRLRCERGIRVKRIRATKPEPIENRDAARDGVAECDAAEVAEIAAASILAKTSRDAWMIEADQRFPGYDFARHKGYSTPKHRALIAMLGPSAIHRRSFSWK